MVTVRIRDGKKSDPGSTSRIRNTAFLALLDLDLDPATQTDLWGSRSETLVLYLKHSLKFKLLQADEVFEINLIFGTGES
jgi:hypothetical protein